MRKEWVDPKDIFVYRELNNRELNQDYIEDISQSMAVKGFLPEFPIDIFKSENLVNIVTDLPFTCACGAHRTIAAVNAKLDRVLVLLHDGREESFIEMMHLDNFKFDPVQHSGIGQPFTQKEKRVAVTQLLLLPKFFEQTNTALEEELRVPASSIRRWRKEVVALLETDSPKLKIWGISDGRLTRLRELAKSSERIDSEGRTVKVRKPLVEVTEAEKKEFYSQMEEDTWDLVGDRDIFDWEHVCTYMQQLWGLRSRWHIYEDVSMQQLQRVHRLILSKDTDFIEAVIKIARKEERSREKRALLVKANNVSFETFKKIFAPKEDKDSTAFRDLCERFLTFLKKHDSRFDNFKISSYVYWDVPDDPNFCGYQAELHRTIAEDLTSGAEWLQEFREKEVKRMQKFRENAMKRWEKNRKAAVEAIEAYPRKIDIGRLLLVGDRVLGMSRGLLPKLAEMEVPSTHKFTSSISVEADLFKKFAYALNNDVEWVQDIPESKSCFVAGVVDFEKEGDALLLNMSLEDIFEHIKLRVEYKQAVSAEVLFDIKSDIFTALGKASYGLFDSQIHLLADIGLFLCQTKEDSPSDK